MSDYKLLLKKQCRAEQGLVTCIHRVNRSLRLVNTRSCPFNQAPHFEASSESDVVVLRQTKHGRLALSSIPIRLGDYTFMARPRCLGEARGPTKRSRDLSRCGPKGAKSRSRLGLVIIY